MSKVSGLSMGETETIDVAEGGTNVMRKVSSGVVKFQPLTIERDRHARTRHEPPGQPALSPTVTPQPYDTFHKTADAR